MSKIKGSPRSYQGRYCYFFKCATTIQLHVVALIFTLLYRYYLLYLRKPKTQMWLYMVEIINKMSKSYKKDNQLGKVR